MALHHVHQIDGNGCFVAAAAMLLGKTYNETLRLVFPNHRPGTYLAAGLTSLDITQAAMDAMVRLGCKVRLSKYEQLRSVKKFAKKNALIILRWKWDIERCHAVVFDADARIFLDPSDYTYDRRDRIKYPTAHIESIMWVDAPSQTRTEKDNAEGRDDQGNQRTAFYPEGPGGNPQQVLRIASVDAPTWRCGLQYGRGSEAAPC